MKRERLPIVITGHVDHGKSTLIGRLLYETGSMLKEKMDEIKKISKELGKDTELAFIIDQFKEEREKSITIDTSQIFFSSRKRNYCIIDAPGHIEFIKNMITGASHAKAAVLIVDVHEGVMEQTKRHAYLIKMLGIEKIIVLCNKMDIIHYDIKRFQEVKKELIVFLHQLSLKTDIFIPISAKEGEGITKKSPRMSWYRGQCFIDALDAIGIKKKEEKKPLRFPVQDIYIVNEKPVIVGRIASGSVKRGETIVSYPSKKTACITEIKVFNKKNVKKAEAVENIGLILNKDIPVKRGNIFVSHKDNVNPVKKIKTNIFWMSPYPLEMNKNITMRCATQKVKCRVEEIESKMNSSSLEIIEDKKDMLELNEVGIVNLISDDPLIVERSTFIEEMGRIIIEERNTIMGAGIIE
jgi:sulfate adenylyltransferase large subunit